MLIQKAQEDQAPTGLRVRFPNSNFSIQFDSILEYAIFAATQDVNRCIQEQLGNADELTEKISNVLRESFWASISMFIGPYSQKGDE